jgi:hypothetical protein
MNLLRAIFNVFCKIFPSCHHDHLTWIFTLQQETYRVCLNCGAHIPYSPVTLRRLSAREVRRMKAAQAGELKIMPLTSNGSVLLPAGRKSRAA